MAQSALVATRLGATDLPTTVAELGAALTAFRPELEATDEARAAARFLLLDPPLPWPARPGYGLIASGGVALLPGWARRALRLPAGGPATTLAGGAGHARHPGGALGDGRRRPGASAGRGVLSRAVADRGDELLDALEGALHVVPGRGRHGQLDDRLARSTSPA